MTVIPTPSGPVLQTGGTLQRLPEKTAPHETLEAVAFYLRDEVRAAHRRARIARDEGKPGYAAFILARSVERQARIVGFHHSVDEVWAAMRDLDAHPTRRHLMAAERTEVRGGPR